MASIARSTHQLKLLAVVGLLVAALPALRAWATWSIVAVDPDTRQVGIAGASCIAGSEGITGLVPGRGVIAAQAFTSFEGRDIAVQMLDSGASPAQVIDSITSRDFDSWWFFDLYPWRQYGVAALGFDEASGNFTGTSTLDWSGGAAGHGFSVQGNTLYGPEVVEQALVQFEATAAGCSSLADRLMAALVAGSAQGGDRRCERQLAALSAFIMVARPDDDPERPYLRLVVTRPGEAGAGLFTVLWRELRRNLFAPEKGSAEENPVTVLHGRYGAWRELHGPEQACSPSPAPAARDAEARPLAP